MILVSKTYWGGLPFWFKRPPDRAHVESLTLRAHDLRQIRANWWTRSDAPSPAVGVVVMHPRVDFTHHYAVPRLVAAGFGVLAANSRHINNEVFAEHEEMVLDLDACVRHLREKRKVAKVVILGNCGGGSLAGFYQAQANRAPADRNRVSPGGSPTRFDSAPLAPGDAVVFVAAHRGQGKILQDCIDPAVVDEADPLTSDAALDMYDPKNGFQEPPTWTAYTPEFVARFREAQAARVARLDAIAREHIARRDEATRESETPDFASRPFAGRQQVLRKHAYEPVMVVTRTMANPSFVDASIEPSDRDYGSLLSERPDLMNYAALGLARNVTPRAWLSTWSGLSSKASLVDNAREITQPTLVVHASRDREVHLERDVKPTFQACAATDKQLVVIEGARHYFEPEPGERDAPHVERLMDVLVPWIQERTG